eukprot:TRINITY_DN9557_c0_g2_i1.p1 TRINITY_DN9557_c0_g2~~TRINITY_DN9557_c0_g2_i1.p1  ORF type:complete len:495 (+),score=99.63 TRINITY_DN9557_c0_g2_i1:237-1721(+)
MKRIWSSESESDEQDLGHHPAASFVACDGLIDFFRRETEQLTADGHAERLGLCSDTAFWYYGCAPSADIGWGCAYRCGQMLLDCALRRRQEPVCIPSILEIQQSLADLGDKHLDPSLLSASFGRPHGLRQADVGGQQFLEPPLVAQLLRSGCFGNPLWMVEFEVTATEVATTDSRLRWYLERHFSDRGPRTAVMCDDGAFAYTICGLRAKDQQWQVLLFDPHLVRGLVSGSDGLTLEQFEDGSAFRVECSSPVFEQGAARWVGFGDLFQHSRWMLCFPVMEMCWSAEFLEFGRIDSALFEAAMIGDSQAVEELLRSGECWLEVHHAPHSRTALHAAARGGHLECVERLLEAKCCVDPTAGGWTPLMNVSYAGTDEAVAKGVSFPEIAEVLLKAGASTKRYGGGRNARGWAVALGNTQMVDVFERFEEETCDREQERTGSGDNGGQAGTVNSVEDGVVVELESAGSSDDGTGDSGDKDDQVNSSNYGVVVELDGM